MKAIGIEINKKRAVCFALEQANDRNCDLDRQTGHAIKSV